MNKTQLRQLVREAIESTTQTAPSSRTAYVVGEYAHAYGSEGAINIWGVYASETEANRAIEEYLDWRESRGHKRYGAEPTVVPVPMGGSIIDVLGWSK